MFYRSRIARLLIRHCNARLIRSRATKQINQEINKITKLASIFHDYLLATSGYYYPFWPGVKPNFAHCIYIQAGIAPACLYNRVSDVQLVQLDSESATDGLPVYLNICAHAACGTSLSFLAVSFI